MYSTHGKSKCSVILCEHDEERARITYRGERLEGAVRNFQDLLLAEFAHVEERRVEALELRLGDDAGPCGERASERVSEQAAC